jgi:hypothetical protein
MSQKIKDISITGGPAFPVAEKNSTTPWVWDGLSKRDYFAAAALTGLLADGASIESVPRWAYEIADEMLEEREK